MSKGNDTFRSTSGSDTFDGGEGRDTVILHGNADGYAIESFNGGIRVIDIDRSDGYTGVDVLTSIEALRFDDGRYTLKLGTPTGTRLEERVNTTITRYGQEAVDIAALSDGGHIVTWIIEDENSSPAGILMQRYDANGMKAGSELQVNTTALEGFRYIKADSTALADGGFIVAWQNGDTTAYTQRYNANGIKVGGETLVSAEAYSVDIAALENGGYVATWTEDAGGSYDVVAQRYDASGNKAGAEAIVGSAGSANVGSCAIASLRDGGYVLAWKNDDVYAQRYDASGNAVGSQFQVNDSPAADGIGSIQITELDGAADDSYAITWSSVVVLDDPNNPYDQPEVHFKLHQKYYFAGNPIGPGEVVTHEPFHENHDVAKLADGGYIVVWEGVGSAAGNFGVCVFAQHYDSDGNRVSSETIVSGTIYAHFSPDVEALENGGYVISWEELYGIFSRRFDADGNALAYQLDITGTAANDAIRGGMGIELLRGIAGNDVIRGGNERDILLGGQGSDRLFGGEGSDRLTGGSGSDKFCFNAIPAGQYADFDTIIDFRRPNDTIVLNTTHYQSLQGVGKELNPDYFKANYSGESEDENDYIIYQIDTGNLYYDSDGTGAAEAVKFAVIGIDSHPRLMTADDFTIV